VTYHGVVVTLVGGEAILGRGKGGDNNSWTDTNLIMLKNKENSRSRFSCYNWTVKV
jgi:hypothetical protein